LLIDYNNDPQFVIEYDQAIYAEIKSNFHYSNDWRVTSEQEK